MSRPYKGKVQDIYSTELDLEAIRLWNAREDTFQKIYPQFRRRQWSEASSFARELMRSQARAFLRQRTEVMA